MSYLLDTASVYWFAFKPYILASGIIVGTLIGEYTYRHMQKRHYKL